MSPLINLILRSVFSKDTHSREGWDLHVYCGSHLFKKLSCKIMVTSQQTTQHGESDHTCASKKCCLVLSLLFTTSVAKTYPKVDQLKINMMSHPCESGAGVQVYPLSWTATIFIWSPVLLAKDHHGGARGQLAFPQRRGQNPHLSIQQLLPISCMRFALISHRPEVSGRS